MLKTGFAILFVELILLYVSLVRYFVTANGKTLGPCIPGSGLRQRDLSSPYLFIFCAERLSAFVDYRELGAESWL